MSSLYFLTASDLASFLGQPDSEALSIIVKLTNALIEDEWNDPTDPVPAAVTNLAWTVAIRAGANPKGLTSWTRSWDDITRTERMEGARRMGVYLTDEEKNILNGVRPPGVKKVRSIRLNVPGWTC